MSSTRFLSSTVLIAAAGLLLPAGAARASDDIDTATKAKIAQFDRGPASIDVSSYPAAIQKNYAIFKQKCTLCHTLARPINCDFALPDEWSRYVKRMMHKPGSMISQANAKKIFEFLAFDSSVRKKALFDAKLAAAAPADRSAAEARIREIVQTYGHD